MKITIPKVILSVDMVEYSPELAGKYLHVWVNPPKDKLQEYDDLVTALQARELETAQRKLFPEGEEKEESGLLRSFHVLTHWLKIKREEKAEGIDEKLLRWYAEIWSQGPEDARWTVEELRTLESQDPAFLSWMISHTWATRTEHLQRKKKV
jgi:hypothetical protein